MEQLLGSESFQGSGVEYFSDGVGLRVEVDRDFVGNTVRLENLLNYNPFSLGAIRFIDQLNNIERGRRMIEVVNGCALDFYRHLLDSGNGSVNIQEYRNLLNDFHEALIALEGIHGNDEVVSFVRTLLIANSLNYAREALLEEIRISALNDDDFQQRLVNLVNIFIFESELFLEDGSDVQLVNGLSTVAAISLGLAWELSWQFYDSPRLGSDSSMELNTQEMFYLEGLNKERLSILKLFKDGFIEVENCFGIPFELMPINRVCGIPGVGKTSTIETMTQIDRLLGFVTKVQEAGGYIKALWSDRQTSLLKLRLAEEAGSADLVAGLLAEEYSLLYYLYREIAVSKAYIDFLESIVARGLDTGIFYAENIPFVPYVHKLASLPYGLNQRIEGSNIETDLWRLPRIDPFQYHLLIEGEFGNVKREPLSVGTLVEYTILDPGGKVKASIRDRWRYMIGPTVIIDSPCDLSTRRLEVIDSDKERQVRMKDKKSWSAWRLTYLVLAEIYPHIGVVHSTVEDETQETGYRVLNQRQVAYLCSSVLTFLRLRLISSNPEIDKHEIRSYLVLLKQRLEKI